MSAQISECDIWIDFSMKDGTHIKSSIYLYDCRVIPLSFDRPDNEFLGMIKDSKTGKEFYDAINLYYNHRIDFDTNDELYGKINYKAVAKINFEDVIQIQITEDAHDEMQWGNVEYVYDPEKKLLSCTKFSLEDNPDFC